MHTTHIIIVSMVVFAAPAVMDANDKVVSFVDGYVHPKTERFTDFTFVSPLPASFVDAYPKRKEMGNQYLDFLGLIAIVGETKQQRADMRRIAHVLMGLIDNDQNGLPDDEQLWNKWKEKVNNNNRLVLYVTEQKAKYKSFDGEHPSVYHQGWSSFRDGEKLQLSNIQEELFHFLQRHLWEIEYPKAFALDANPRSIAHHAALKAVTKKHYVYDDDCVSHSGCLVPEFFFCAMTDVMDGWQGDGFDAPGKEEWRLKGNRNAIRKNFPDMMEMVLTMQNQGKLPKRWPSFFLHKDRGTGRRSTDNN
ncbi:MAG: hypothetical protein P8N76_12425 [Pirellulaceae bacterium]|nr:hypothetical protein [Pirellulaceae bacterium]